MFDTDKENRGQVFMASPACGIIIIIPCSSFCRGKGGRDKESKKGFGKVIHETFIKQFQEGDL